MNGEGKIRAAPRLGVRIGEALALAIPLLFADVVMAASPNGQIVAERLAIEQPSPIRVSADGRYLVTSDGQPFFWLADTAWMLFTRLDREEADRYLLDRAAKGFNVVQAVIGGPIGGLASINRYGEAPFFEGDLDRPNERYFEHVDRVVDRARALGIHVALLPVWGFTDVSLRPGVIGPEQAKRYGEWIAERYRGKAIIWVMGGDTNPLWPRDLTKRDFTLIDHRPVFDAMAAGIEAVEGPEAFITYHPTNLSYSGAAKPRTSLYFHDRTWLDMNMLQSSHFREPSLHNARLGADFSWLAEKSYEPIREEYLSKPVRPVIDGEPRFEDLTIDLMPNAEHGYWSGDDARAAAYQAVFAGTAGHTYGHHSIWQFYRPDGAKYQLPRDGIYWEKALARPVTGQLRHLKALMLSRPYFSRDPNQSLLKSDGGDGAGHVAALLDRHGRFGMIYLPTGQPVSLDLEKLAPGAIKGWWFDPRSGEVSLIRDRLAAKGRRLFVPPDKTERDWVLVLDSAAQNFTPPGASLYANLGIN